MKVEKYYCDICGKEIPYSATSMPVNVLDITLDTPLIRPANLDICEECLLRSTNIMYTTQPTGKDEFNLINKDIH